MFDFGWILRVIDPLLSQKIAVRPTNSGIALSALRCKRAAKCSLHPANHLAEMTHVIPKLCKTGMPINWNGKTRDLRARYRICDSTYNVVSVHIVYDEFRRLRSIPRYPILSRMSRPVLLCRAMDHNVPTPTSRELRATRYLLFRYPGLPDRMIARNGWEMHITSFGVTSTSSLSVFRKLVSSNFPNAFLSPRWIARMVPVWVFSFHGCLQAVCNKFCHVVNTLD